MHEFSHTPGFSTLLGKLLFYAVFLLIANSAISTYVRIHMQNNNDAYCLWDKPVVSGSMDKARTVLARVHNPETTCKVPGLS